MEAEALGISEEEEEEEEEVVVVEETGKNKKWHQGSQNGAEGGSSHMDTDLEAK